MKGKILERWIRWTEKAADDSLDCSVEPGLGCVDGDGYPVLSSVVQPWEQHHDSPINFIMSEARL